MSDLAKRMRDIFSGSSRKDAGYRGYPVTTLKNLEENNDGPVTSAVTPDATVVVTAATPVVATDSVTEKYHVNQCGNQVTAVTTQKQEVKREKGETAPQGRDRKGDEPADKGTKISVGRCGKTVVTTDARNDIPAVFAVAYSRLIQTCPDKVDQDRWLRARADACAFLATWGEQAAALGWTSEALFGLHQPPPRPSSTYHRLSRCDATGLVWLLDGRRVVALTEDAATIRSPGGVNLTFRRRVAT
jgi:hypothetical protein